MKKIIRTSVFLFSFIAILFVVNSCSKDDDSNPDYVGTWYRFQLNSSASELNVVVFKVGYNTVEVILYQAKGKNMNLPSGTISNVKKTVETYTFTVDSNNIVSIKDGTAIIQYKYSIVENQLILTDMKTGNLLGLFRAEGDILTMISNLDKISF